MNKPNMAPEIIEAIHLFHEDNPEVEADCYLCLTGLSGNVLAKKLASAGYKALEDMDRCPECGCLMGHMTHKEYHTELEDCPVEILNEEYCPNCDVRENYD